MEVVDSTIIKKEKHENNKQKIKNNIYNVFSPTRYKTNKMTRKINKARNGFPCSILSMVALRSTNVHNFFFRKRIKRCFRYTFCTNYTRKILSMEKLFYFDKIILIMKHKIVTHSVLLGTEL